jgi:hypothetical protein
VDFRSPNGGSAWRASWDLTVAGDPSAGRQHATIVREIRRLRHYYARTGEAAVPATCRQLPHHRAAPLWRRFAPMRLTRAIERTGPRMGATAAGAWPSRTPGAGSF